MMSKWYPITSAPKDGTVVDFWNFRTEAIVKGMCWGSSAERDPVNYGKGERWSHLGLTGWYEAYNPLQDAGTIYKNTYYSHWRIPPDDHGPTVEQMNEFYLIKKLKGENV